MLSLVAESRDMQTVLLARVFLRSVNILRNSQTGYWRPSFFATEPLSFSQDAGCNAFSYIAYNTHSRIHETATIAKRPLQHCPTRSSRTTVCFANSVISPYNVLQRRKTFITQANDGNAHRGHPPTALSNFVRVRCEFFGQFRRVVRTKIRPSSICTS